MRYRALVFALVLLWPTSGLAVSLTYQATLSGGAEFPPVASAGTGVVTVILDTAAHTLSIDTAFSGLGANTTVAHIHCCVSPSAAIPVAGVATPTPSFPDFPAGATAGIYSRVLDLTQAASWNASFVTANGSVGGAEAALAAALDAGHAYLNIHTTAFPGGEIRGFLTPEPSTATLVAMGLVLMAVARRRRGLRLSDSGLAC